MNFLLSLSSRNVLKEFCFQFSAEFNQKSFEAFLSRKTFQKLKRKQINNFGKVVLNAEKEYKNSNKYSKLSQLYSIQTTKAFSEKLFSFFSFLNNFFFLSYSISAINSYFSQKMYLINTGVSNSTNNNISLHFCNL